MRQQLEASAANKESFFARRRMVDNESKPKGVPSSQGGKYVGFGSSPASSANRNSSAAQDGVMQVVSQVIAKVHVPIVKFLERNSRIAFDISFHIDDGPQATYFIKDVVKKLPALRPFMYDSEGFPSSKRAQ